MGNNNKCIIIILLFSSSLFAQPKLELNKILIGSAIGFMGGVASGYHEVTLHHYPQFKKIHPFANDDYFYRTSLLCATMYVTIGEKKPWWHYAINVASTLVARRIGFGIVYDYIYK